jgi:type I restriction enzyme R subunit
MAHFDLTERYDFQQWIITDLETENGFTHRPQSNYNQRLAMDTDILWEFLRATQEDEMDYLLKKLDKEVILNLINQEIIKGGLLFALKSGVYIENKQLKLVYPKPATSFNAKAVKRYEQNRFTVMEEVVYKDQERVDLVIFLNGLALFAIELKLNSSGQSVDDAIRQLKKRDSKNRLFKFNAGVLASFAVDTLEVYMTTEIKEQDTYFLPFNMGKGEGVDQGAGNPHNESGPDTAYFWKEVLAKDSILQLIERFIFLKVDRDKKGKKTLIFPRYQQRRAVNRVL